MRQENCVPDFSGTQFQRHLMITSHKKHVTHKNPVHSIHLLNNVHVALIVPVVGKCYTDISNSCHFYSDLFCSRLRNHQKDYGDPLRPLPWSTKSARLTQVPLNLMLSTRSMLHTTSCWKKINQLNEGKFCLYSKSAWKVWQGDTERQQYGLTP